MKGMPALEATSSASTCETLVVTEDFDGEAHRRSLSPTSQKEKYLTLKLNQTVVQLQTWDDGWAFGRCGSSEGLYPANFAHKMVRRRGGRRAVAKLAENTAQRIRQVASPSTQSRLTQHDGEPMSAHMTRLEATVCQLEEETNVSKEHLQVERNNARIRENNNAVRAKPLAVQATRAKVIETDFEGERNKMKTSKGNKVEEKLLADTRMRVKELEALLVEEQCKLKAWEDEAKLRDKLVADEIARVKVLEAKLVEDQNAKHVLEEEKKMQEELATSEMARVRELEAELTAHQNSVRVWKKNKIKLNEVLAKEREMWEKLALDGAARVMQVKAELVNERKKMCEWEEEKKVLQKQAAGDTTCIMQLEAELAEERKKMRSWEQEKHLLEKLAADETARVKELEAKLVEEQIQKCAWEEEKNALEKLAADETARVRELEAELVKERNKMFAWEKEKHLLKKSVADRAEHLIEVEAELVKVQLKKRAWEEEKNLLGKLTADETARARKLEAELVAERKKMPAWEVKKTALEQQMAFEKACIEHLEAALTEEQSKVRIWEKTNVVQQKVLTNERARVRELEQKLLEERNKICIWKESIGRRKLVVDETALLKDSVAMLIDEQSEARARGKEKGAQEISTVDKSTHGTHSEAREAERREMCAQDKESKVQGKIMADAAELAEWHNPVENKLREEPTTENEGERSATHVPGVGECSEQSDQERQIFVYHSQQDAQPTAEDAVDAVVLRNHETVPNMAVACLTEDLEMVGRTAPEGSQNTNEEWESKVCTLEHDLSIARDEKAIACQLLQVLLACHHSNLQQARELNAFKLAYSSQNELLEKVSANVSSSMQREKQESDAVISMLHKQMERNNEHFGTLQSNTQMSSTHTRIVTTGNSCESSFDASNANDKQCSTCSQEAGSPLGPESPPSSGADKEACVVSVKNQPETVTPDSKEAPSDSECNSRLTKCDIYIAELQRQAEEKLIGKRKHLGEAFESDCLGDVDEEQAINRSPSPTSLEVVMSHDVATGQSVSLVPCPWSADCYDGPSRLERAAKYRRITRSFNWHNYV